MKQYSILNLDTTTEEEKRKVFYRWSPLKPGEKVRMQIAGLGDVGGTVLLGLLLTAENVIKDIGIYDKNQLLCTRWELETAQVASPFERREVPAVHTLDEDELFQCDIFVFCIAKCIPPIGGKEKDVRMAQFEENRKIVSAYARMAADRGYQGLFLVVSDPVDLLCKAALLASQEGLCPLEPEQIQGCGLGVMNARALYYAKKDVRCQMFEKEGRVFGPHGKELVVANSIIPEHYDHALSLYLTEQTVNANMQVRKTGFKPYIAPAISSAAYTIPKIISGQWNYSSNYLSGVYFGAKNRRTDHGIEWENTELHPILFERIKEAYESLRVVL